VSVVYFSAHTMAAAEFANNVVFTAIGIGLFILVVSLVVRRLRRKDG